MNLNGFKGFILSLLGSMAATGGLTACAEPPTSAVSRSGDSILGGEVVAHGDSVEAFTGLLYNRAGGMCTVSILSKEWMLTAAHCVEGARPEDLIVIFAPTIQLPANDAAAKDQLRQAMRQVVAFTAHSQYALTMKRIETLNEESLATQGRELTMDEVDQVTDWGDVALVQITGGLPDTHRPVRLMDDTQTLVADQSVVLAGYGNIAGGPLAAGAGTLRKVAVTISKPIFGTTEVLLDQRKGKGACHGDSGGPAYASIAGELRLFGVTSRGYQDEADTCSQFAVYTNALHYRPWIREVAGL